MIRMNDLPCGKAPARNIRLLLEYDGRPFHGWQVQPKYPTIQELLQEALVTITGQQGIVVRGSGRTDAGVHALGQVANFHTFSPLPADTFRRALNGLLPTAISVLSAQEMPADFDARYSAAFKTYMYRLLLRPSRSALHAGQCWHIPYSLREEAMEEAAGKLLGTKDFSSFRSSGCTSRTTQRSLTGLRLCRRSPYLEIELVADGFLRHMARAIVGTLVDVGRGKVSASDMETILQARDRSRAGRTAPPHGLFLVSVFYPGAPPWPSPSGA
jgi:tRNA pseudouridine38-40 synthase